MGMLAVPVMRPWEPGISFKTKEGLSAQAQRRRGMAGLVALWAERVDDIMSGGITAVEPDESVVAAVDLMIETRRRSLPVVERRPAGGVVGMISRSDVLRCLILGTQEAP
jgi:CBS domain-containing protein